MKKLWLVREPCMTIFDVKPVHEALGTGKMASSVELELSDLEYDAYTNACNDFYAWQARLYSYVESKI